MSKRLINSSKSSPVVSLMVLLSLTTPQQPINCTCSFWGVSCPSTLVGPVPNRRHRNRRTNLSELTNRILSPPQTETISSSCGLPTEWEEEGRTSLSMSSETFISKCFEIATNQTRFSALVPFLSSGAVRVPLPLTPCTSPFIPRVELWGQQFCHCCSGRWREKRCREEGTWCWFSFKVSSPDELKQFPSSTG